MGINNFNVSVRLRSTITKPFHYYVMIEPDKTLAYGI